MITLDKISLHRGSKTLLENASAVIHPGQKSALIGANGSGKSSLFQLLLSSLSTDSGNLFIPKGWKIAHMAQEVASSDRPALEYIIDGDSRLRALEAAIEQAEQNHHHNELAKLHEQLDDIGGYNAKVRAEQLLLGLGFTVADTQKPANQFSGGWRIRLNLAQALMSPSDLLLLDEPTNHLDLDAELWLEQWLKRYEGTLLLISHDRDFIDNTCQQILHIEHKSLSTYKGNYSAFERQRAEKLSQQQANYEKQQQRIKEIQGFVNRFRAKATKAKQAQSRLKELARMEEIAPAHIDSPFNFTFFPPVKFSDPLLNLSKVDIGYKKTIIVSNVNISIHPGSRIGLLGANGAGKSTLIKTLAKEIPLINGHRTEGEHFNLGYFSQHQLEALDLKANPALHLQRLTPTASEQAIRNFLGGFNFHGEMALDPIENFSGGEKARLALAIIVWQKPNMLLLDEPTNHLDLEMCHALTVALQGFEGAVIIVSHDRHLLRNTVDQFLLVHDGCADYFDGSLDDYSRLLAERRKSDKTKPAITSQDTDDSTFSKKDARKNSADARKKLAPLKNALKKTETNISRIEETLSNIEQSLSGSEIYDENNKEELKSLLKEQANLSSEKELLEGKWFNLSDEIESF
jgi:ATP-binding cassette subfamily F protein 3